MQQAMQELDAAPHRSQTTPSALDRFLKDGVASIDDLAGTIVDLIVPVTITMALTCWFVWLLFGYSPMSFGSQPYVMLVTADLHSFFVCLLHCELCVVDVLCALDTQDYVVCDNKSYHRHDDWYEFTLQSYALLHVSHGSWFCGCLVFPHVAHWLAHVAGLIYVGVFAIGIIVATFLLLLCFKYNCMFVCQMLRVTHRSHTRAYSLCVFAYTDRCVKSIVCEHALHDKSCVRCESCLTPRLWLLVFCCCCEMCVTISLCMYMHVVCLSAYVPMCMCAYVRVRVYVCVCAMLCSSFLGGCVAPRLP